MPTFSPGFTISLLTDSSSIAINDTSTGSDPAITTRYIYIQTATGSYLVPPATSTNYIVWPLSAGNTIDLSVLDVDYSAVVRIEWRSNSGVLYSLNSSEIFAPHSLYAGWQLLSRLSINPALVNQAAFWLLYCKLFTLIAASNNAIAAGGDLTAAQVALNISTLLINNELAYYI